MLALDRTHCHGTGTTAPLHQRLAAKRQEDAEATLFSRHLHNKTQKSCPLIVALLVSTKMPLPESRGIAILRINRMPTIPTAQKRRSIQQLRPDGHDTNNHGKVASIFFSIIPIEPQYNPNITPMGYNPKPPFEGVNHGGLPCYNSKTICARAHEIPDPRSGNASGRAVYWHPHLRRSSNGLATRP